MSKRLYPDLRKKSAFLRRKVRAAMGTLVFTCPETKLNVQQWFDDAEATHKNEYVSIPCQACTKLHFINWKTGKLLGHNKE